MSVPRRGRAIARILYKTDEFGAEGVRSCGDKALNLEAALAPYRNKGSLKVQDELPQNGEIVSGVISTGAHWVASQDDIHALMQAVLDASVHVQQKAASTL